MFKKANQAFRKGYFDEAIITYQSLIEKNKKFYTYYENAGWAYLKQGKYKQALKFLSKAYLLNQGAIRAYSFLRTHPRDSGIKLSIVVPVFNSGKYLEQCLRSILDQTEKSIEIIVINDGSTDNSINIITELMKEDGRIVFINNIEPSGNPGTPRNQGITIARGKYLGFVDSDDWVDPDYFAALLSIIEKDNSDIAFAAGYVNHVQDKQKTVIYNSQHFNNTKSGLYRYHESFMIWNKIYRTNLIKNLSIRLGETKAAVDVPFIFKAYYLLKNGGFADTKGYHYRRESSSSVTVNFRKSSNCDFEIQAYKDVENWCEDTSVTAEYRDLVKFRKVSSYIYTLRVISSSEFHTFFAKIKPELMAISSGLIEKISRNLKKPQIFERFKAITTGNADAYIRVYRDDFSKMALVNSAKYADTETQITIQSAVPVERPFNIEGKNKGVLFFPDWSHTNPYQKLFYASLAQNFSIRIKGNTRGRFTKKVLDENKSDFIYLHLHWLHTLMDVSQEGGADDILSKLKYAKKLGYKIIYTAHNILSHDGKFLERERRFRKKIAAYFDYVLVHGEFAKQRVVNEIGVDERKIHVMPHGTYQGYYLNHVTRDVARRKLEIGRDKFVFLFFGNIKGYKGVDALLEAYRKISSERDNVTLLIAGRVFDREIEAKIYAYVETSPGILFKPSFIEEDNLQYYFNAADLVVLPYKRILTSGAALLSVSFSRPVIAPRAGVIPEFLEEGRHGYLFDDYDGMLALMRRAVTDQRRDPKAWATQFDFTELNARLRWPLLTSHPVFGDIFSAAPRFEDYTEKHSRYRYALIRILGNDLPLRHAEDQTYNNLKFTLEHEMEFDSCLKLWVLNRIVDTKKKQKLIELLSMRGKQYIDIPYEVEEFAKVGYCFEDLPRDDWKLTPEFKTKVERIQLVADTAILRSKNNYIINNNGARNRALQEGMLHADWVFPWDGNCYVTTQAWASITSMLQARSDLQYHIVPMDRLQDNRDILREDYVPNPCEEPQIIFRKDATLRFDEWLMYGLQPKVELLKRLGVSGVWDNWKKLYPWKNEMKVHHGSYTHNYSWAGWVARLFSGNSKQELDADQRAKARRIGIISFISKHDKAYLYRNFKRDNLVFYDKALLEKMRSRKSGIDENLYAKTLDELATRAREYVTNPLYSVLDKTTLPPSGDRRDYWHPAPYFWPNPTSPNGLPYIYKDGERVPGTRMYEAESNKYDRTAIQRVFDETTTLALAGHVFSNAAYTEKAAKLIRCWFTDERTAMNPHLTYSQVVMGRNRSHGTASGLIETKDLYYFLDAVRLVSKSNFWSDKDEQKMQEWCRKFLIWLNTSDQGKQEVATVNNHGVAYDLQTYALSAFVGDVEQMYTILLRALSRMKGHVDNNGRQPHEMKRTTTAHYTAFNLHLWFNLATLLQKTAGYNLFNEQRDYGGVKLNPLKKAVSWVLARASGDWPFKQIDEFDKDRYQHLYHIASQHSLAIREKYRDFIKEFSESKVVFFPHDGIAPYWTLQR